MATSVDQNVPVLNEPAEIKKQPKGGECFYLFSEQANNQIIFEVLYLHAV